MFFSDLSILIMWYAILYYEENAFFKEQWYVLSLEKKLCLPSPLVLGETFVMFSSGIYFSWTSFPSLSSPLTFFFVLLHYLKRWSFSLVSCSPVPFSPAHTISFYPISRFLYVYSHPSFPLLNLSFLSNPFLKQTYLLGFSIIIASVLASARIPYRLFVFHL